MVHVNLAELFGWFVGMILIMDIPLFWVLYSTQKTKEENSKEKSQKIKENFIRQMSEINSYEDGYCKGYADAKAGLRSEFWYRDQ